MIRYGAEVVLNYGTAWLFTYLVCSTVVFGVIAVVARSGWITTAEEDLLWRGALGVVPLVVTARILLANGADAVWVMGPELLAVRGTIGWTLAGAAVLSLFMAGWGTSRLRRTVRFERGRLRARVPVREGPVLEELRALSQNAGRRVPKLTQSDAVFAPVAIGRNEICIPECICDRLAGPRMRAVLAHEMAHLARGDTRWSMMVQVVERMFLLQPLHRWISRRLRDNAEFLADDFAVRQTGGPEPLVDALLTFARTSGRSLATNFAPGSLLVRRVERVLFRPLGDEGVRMGVLAVLLTATAAAGWFSPAVVPDCTCRLAALLPRGVPFLP